MDPTDLARSDIQSAISSAVEEVLETMCFTPVMESGDGPPAALEAPALLAQLEFEGVPSGSFRIEAPAQLGRCIAGSFLGKDDCEISEEHVAQVLCELTNMFCGAVLSRLEQDATFHLYHPRFEQAPEPAPAPEGAVQRWFDLGDGVMGATLAFSAE